jgi:hypothetical protein
MASDGRSVKWLFLLAAMMMVVMVVHMHLGHLVLGTVGIAATLGLGLFRLPLLALAAGSAFLGLRFVWLACHVDSPSPIGC